MAPNTTFESLNFNRFVANDSLSDNGQDTDVNFFSDNVAPLDTDHISPDDFSRNFKDFKENSFSVLHLNIWSLNKKFDPFAELYKSLKLVSASFYQLFVFPQNNSPSKTMKSAFILSKKLFSLSRYSHFGNFFPSFPHFPDKKVQMEVE